MSELDKAKIDFITDPNELRFHAENPIEEDGRIHVTPELLFAVADKIDGLRAEIASRDAALNELLLLIEEHGAEHIRSHAKQIWKIRMYAKDEETFIRKSVADEAIARLNEIIKRLKEDAIILALMLTLNGKFKDSELRNFHSVINNHIALMKEVE